MLDPSTLRGRLTWTYATALIAALIAFSAFVLVVLDGAQRSAMDAQLGAIARGVLAIVDHSGDRLTLDAGDRRQFETIVGANANGAVFRSDGTLVAATRVAVPSVVRATSLSVRADSLLTRSDGGDALRLIVVPIAVDGAVLGAVVVWRDIDEIELLDRNVGLTFALAIPVIAAVAILLGGAIARRGLAALDRIATLASEIEAHDIGRRLALPPRTDELGRLAATFDRMLDRLGAAFARERRFTSDASHELRAPLSVIRAEADLALRKDRDARDYRKALEIIVEQADALEHLTRELLAAARADAATGSPPATADLSDVVHAVGARLRVLAAERGVSLSLEDGPRAGAGLVRVDGATIERALVPIVHNAITHARTRVELRTAKVGDFEEVVVCDDGPGFTDEALERAFDRFWRDDEARGREGSGLGMAIARAIVVRAAGTIAIANRAEGGASVCVRLPRP